MESVVLEERIWLTYLDVIHLLEECDDFVPLVSRYCSGISQYRVGNYYLDGFRELPGGCGEFYEFYGCYYHGCDVCYMDRSRAVRCKSQEQGYVTIDKVQIDMFECERMIRSLQSLIVTKIRGLRYGNMSSMRGLKSSNWFWVKK